MTINTPKKIEITFDKTSAKFVYDLIIPSLKTRNCFSCNRAVFYTNLGGIGHLKGEPRMFHSDFPCILQASKELNL